MEIDLPEVRQEVEVQFQRYEAALMENDVSTLNELFWDSPHTLRYGVREALQGYDEIKSFRQARDVTGLRRTLENTVITTFGLDFAIAFTEYRRTESGRRGRQSQTWMRRPEGWRIVAAHVSLLPENERT